MSVASYADEAPLQYTVSFHDCDRHTIDIEAMIPTSGQEQVELTLPTWTPGSYLIREYARHISEIKATNPADGSSLTIEKRKKNSWAVTCRGIPLVTVRYRLYCREMGVRNNWVERDFGFLTGAATFITRKDWMHHPHVVRLNLPSQWPHVATSLPAVDGPDVRRADNYDVLVDSPILMGRLDQRAFEVGGKTHYLVNALADELWDSKKAVEDMSKIVATEQAFWGEVPYESYYFLNIMSESGGGLEHDNSCVLMTSRWSMKKRGSYSDWLALVSHEFFHAWNVRRLRPQVLMKYDYDGEQYFPELWVAEGITSYYDDLFLPKAGLATREDYLGRLSKQIAGIQMGNGRHVQSLADSSLDAWIKFYRPDENAGNTRISYYVKGAVVGFLLDCEIQRRTNGQKQLMDVMRLLWSRHRVTGYTQADLQIVVNEVCGANLDDWMKTYVFTTDELDYQPALEWLGLRFKHEAKKDTPPKTDGPAPASPAKPPEEANLPGWLGVETAERDGRTTVVSIPRGCPGDEAGINVDDELIGIEEYRLSGGLASRLEVYKPGDRIRLLIARRGKLIELHATLGVNTNANLATRSSPGSDGRAKGTARQMAWSH